MNESERQYHEVANIFPLMQPNEYDSLKADIKSKGLLEPVWLHPENHTIVDGRNRHRACVELGVAPKFRYWDGKGSLVGFVVSLNLKRRHLDESQRAMVAARIANMKQGDNRFTIDRSIDPSIGQAEAAEILNVSVPSLKRAKVVQDHGTPKLIAAVEKGEVAVSTAAVIAQAPPEEQVVIVAQGPKEVMKSARNIREKKSEAKRQEKEAKKQEVLAKYDDVDKWSGELKVNTISLADIYTLHLPSESVDMVFTDPPYHDEYVDLYEQLARVADVALKPGGYLMTYVGKMFLPEIMKHLSAKLEYVSIYAVFQPFSQARITKHNVFENWRPILVFKKPGKTETKEWAQDVVRGTRDKSHHEWQQDTEAPLQYIAAYTKPGDIVLDPFVGGGTTPWSCKQLGRYYVCFDASEKAVKLSTERVRNG